MDKDWHLSPHFSYYELTVTANKELQDVNRREGLSFIHPLVELANLLEGIREALKRPISIHSGFRCPQLNGATPGSSYKSQHMKGEAADFTAAGGNVDIGETFSRTLEYLAGSGRSFRQLIKESADRDYGTAHWIHVSLGLPRRPQAHCGEVMTAHNGVFELLQRVGAG